ncbi:MAG: hypothetical protein U9O20_00260 [Patescibacteria group bacterium]|nr:hypothetical protein [Patescibacteria group bacterium]
MRTKAISKSLPIIGLETKDLLWTTTLTLLAIIAPALLAHTPHNQWITGTIVNALLFIAAWRLGLANAILVAVLPSSVALMRGLLPAPMAILIPYIIFSNVLLILTFSFLKKNLTLGVSIASFVKFTFLFGVSLYFAPKLLAPMIMMLQWSQLITALAGGFVAAMTISLLKKTTK